MSHFNARMHACRFRGVMLEESARPLAPAPPGREEIATLAYAYWEARGRREGTAVEDWLTAERELRERSAGVR